MFQLLKIYKFSCMCAALLFCYLSYSLIFTGELFLLGLGIDSNQATLVVAKRAGALMLGFSVLMFMARSLEEAQARLVVSVSLIVTMLMLATLGGFEFVRGTVSQGIFTAIIIESLIASTFVCLSFAEFRMLKHQKQKEAIN